MGDQKVYDAAIKALRKLELMITNSIEDAYDESGNERNMKDDTQELNENSAIITNALQYLKGSQ